MDRQRPRAARVADRPAGSPERLATASCGRRRRGSRHCAPGSQRPVGVDASALVAHGPQSVEMRPVGHAPRAPERRTRTARYGEAGEDEEGAPGNQFPQSLGAPGTTFNSGGMGAAEE